MKAMPGMIWDDKGQCVPHTEEDLPLIHAAARCFAQPGEDSLKALQDLLHAPVTSEGHAAVGAGADESREDWAALMRQCVLVVQTANIVLDAEGTQLAGIFAAQGKPVVCKAGCTGCCHHLVLSQPFEARYIQVYLQAHPAALQAFATAYALWDQRTASLRASYLAWGKALYTEGKDDGSHKVDDFAVPCPFLDQRGHCSIYPVRPYACRTCMALDPACPAPPPGSQPLNMHYSLYTTHHAARQAVLVLLLQRLGASSEPMPMPQMVALCCL